MNKTILKLVGAAAAAMLAGLPATTSIAQEQIKLRLAHSFPTAHFIQVQAVAPWMAQITEATNGRVTFEEYPAEQLGKAKDMLTLTQNGVTDIGYVGQSYVSDKMPLSGVAQLPGSFPSSCVGTKAFWEVANQDPIKSQEFDANNVHLLFAFVLEPYQIYTANKKVQNASDAKGLKLRSTGGAMDLFARKIDAIPVRMTATEVRESLSRGTLDGLIFPNQSVISYDLVSLVKYATRGGNFGSFIVTFVINNNVWNKLPDDVKEIMTKASEAMVTTMCENIDRDIEKAIGEMTAQGVEYYTLTDEDLATFAKHSDAVADEWAKDLDGRGKPGSEVLAQFRAALAKQQ